MLDKALLASKETMALGLGVIRAFAQVPHQKSRSRSPTPILSEYDYDHMVLHLTSISGCCQVAGSRSTVSIVEYRNTSPHRLSRSLSTQKGTKAIKEEPGNCLEANERSKIPLLLVVQIRVLYYYASVFRVNLPPHGMVPPDPGPGHTVPPLSYARLLTFHICLYSRT